MISNHKLEDMDSHRKIPKDLTEASLSSCARLSLIAAFCMVFLFAMELKNYLTVSTSTSVIVDNSSDGELLRIDFNISFPELPCEFASVDMSDVLGANRLDITNTIRKFPIDSDLNTVDEEFTEGSITLSQRNFDRVAHRHPILVVNFYASWCYWSKKLKPSWEEAARIIRERYDPEVDGRILLAMVECSVESDLCRRHHIEGYPSIRIFRQGSDVRNNHGSHDHERHDHESYYGERDTESLVKTMENLVAPIPLQPNRPAPIAGGCRIEGFVCVKKVPGSLVISTRSGSHSQSFDASKMNMSHIISHFSFGKQISPTMMSDMKQLLPYLGGSHNKLSGQEYITHPDDSNANVTIEHYLQVVKTEVVTRSYPEQKIVEEYEYTAHSSIVHGLDIPVAKFHFELSPLQVQVISNRKLKSPFLTSSQMSAPWLLG